MRPVGLVLALSDAGLAELFEARKLVEPGLADARRGAHRRRGGGRGLMPLRARHRRRALADAEAFMWHDIELHALIARAADNAILSRLLDSIASHGHRQPAADRAPGARARAERARPSRDRRGNRGA